MNNSIGKYDYTLTQGIVLICALLICGTNLITDLVYALIDPRIGPSTRPASQFSNAGNPV